MPSSTFSQSRQVSRPVAAARLDEDGVGGGVGHPEPSCGEQIRQGEQPVQESAERVGRARPVLHFRLEVVAVGDPHHRRAHLSRSELPVQREVAVRLVLVNRPEREVVGSKGLQNGSHHHHMGMMQDPPLHRHGLSVAAPDSERARCLGSFAVRTRRTGRCRRPVRRGNAEGEVAEGIHQGQ
ncbi:hypothetical protein [Streptomyces sp. AC154]|uniref:hypothetical protein n=1 Tax=Streptomyces sp. AC154 TaxID=3143184 RepID=UPI003F7FAFC7